MYMQNHRCKVTGTTSTKTLATAQPPVWCRDDPAKCVSGAKQMLAWNRKSKEISYYQVAKVLTVRYRS